LRDGAGTPEAQPNRRFSVLWAKSAPRTLTATGKPIRRAARAASPGVATSRSGGSPIQTMSGGEGALPQRRKGREPADAGMAWVDRVERAGEAVPEQVDERLRAGAGKVAGAADDGDGLRREELRQPAHASRSAGARRR
jgi:hypothetical protein